MMASTRGAKEVPHIDILFLGSPGVGKATFLSRLSHVQHPSVGRREAASRAAPPPATRLSLLNASLESTHSLSGPPAADFETPPPAYTSPTSLPFQPRPPAHSLSEPLTFKVSLFARPYSITIHPSTSQLFTDPFPVTPHFVIICFAVNSKASLHNAQHYWHSQFHMHYPASSAPTMLLGLQRDLRTADQCDDGQYVCVMPEEGLEAARKMRCDRYAECSARTGELMWEVVEDITRTAAKTTLDQTYASDMCATM